MHRFLRAGPAPDALLRGGVDFATGRDIRRAVAVNEVVDIEESIWSTKYGVKGMIDVRQAEPARLARARTPITQKKLALAPACLSLARCSTLARCTFNPAGLAYLSLSRGEWLAFAACG